MKVLKEVSILLDQKGRKNLIESLTLDMYAENEQRFKKFYTGLVKKQYKTENEAKVDVFGPDINESTYKNFKKKLKEKLLDGLFFLNIESSSKSETYKSYFRVNKYLHAAKILLANGARNSAIHLLNKSQSLASDYERTEEEMIALRHLKRHYSLVGDNTRFLKYRQEFRKSIAKYQSEIEAEDMWYELLMEYSASVAYKPELEKTAYRYMQKSKEFLQESDSFHLNLLSYRISDMYYQIRHDFPRALKVCEEAQEFCKKYPKFNSKFLQGEMSIKKLSSYLHLQDYENGKLVADECKQYYPASSINRLIFFEYYFLLAMHTGRYQAAVKIFKDATQHPRFPNLQESRHEKWRIFEAYLHYVLEAQQEEHSSEYYNFFRLFNEVPVFSKDKKGYNVSILVIQFLFFLQRGEYDALILRSEALRTYNYRHLSKDLTPRSRAFINMLLVTQNKNFDYEEVHEATKKYRKILDEENHNYMGKIESMEVIPYETLWQWVEETMKSKV